MIKLLSPSGRLLHESVRWLASQGRIDECLAILASIAKKNGREVDDEVYQSFRVSCMQASLPPYVNVMHVSIMWLSIYVSENGSKAI